MGSYAASGGIGSRPTAIASLAEPSTNHRVDRRLWHDVRRAELANGLASTFDTVKTGRFADTLTIARARDRGGAGHFQRMVDWIYEQFVTKVAEARKLDRQVVEEIGPGPGVVGPRGGEARPGR